MFSRSVVSRVAVAVPAAHPLMAPMYWVCVDLLALASELAQGAVPSTAHQLRANLNGLFTAMDARGSAMGVLPEDLASARYALVALFDEILVQANWQGRAEWQASPLQFLQFQENTAGENFFQRAEALSQQAHRAHVLQIYFLCLCLGFQGRYAMAPPRELEAVMQGIAGVVREASLPAEVLSPHGIPADAGQTLLQREAPIVRLGLACLAGALLVYFMLLGLRAFQLDRAIEPMRAFGAQSVTRPGKP